MSTASLVYNYTVYKCLTVTTVDISRSSCQPELWRSAAQAIRKEVAVNCSAQVVVTVHSGISHCEIVRDPLVSSFATMLLIIFKKSGS